MRRDVANLNERKNPLTHMFGVKGFVCLSTTSTPIITGLAKLNYPDRHHFQRGMKFASQISPLPNCYFGYYFYCGFYGDWGYFCFQNVVDKWECKLKKKCNWGL